MRKWSTLRAVLSFLVVVVMCLSPLAQRGNSAPESRDPGSGVQPQDDPCTHLPKPPGKAIGIHNQCPPRGTSSGIAKGDFNGDGYADLAIGEPNSSIGGHASAGDVIILFGGPSGLTTTGREDWDLGKIPIEFSNTGGRWDPEAGDHFGSALASGDFNGDGFSDLAIGVPGRTIPDPLPFFAPHKNAGAVVILYGSKNGLVTTSTATGGPTNYCDLRCGAPSTYTSSFLLDNAFFGASLAWGNFNGDKNNGNDIGDLAIGIPGATTEIFGAIVTDYEGAVVVVPGNATSGLGDAWGLNATLLTEFGSLGIGDHVFDEFGSALTAGDFNGDGISDLAIGAPSYSNYVNPEVKGGIVGVIYGSKAGLNPFGTSSTPAAQVWASESFGAMSDDGDGFGGSLASGDFNGDGKADLAIGAAGKADVLAEAGVVFVVAGGASGLTTTGRQIWTQATLGRGAQGGAQFGWAMAAGDFNHDGSVDLAIGAPFRDIGGLANAGEVDVIYGSTPAGLSMTAVRTPQFWTQNNALGAGNAQAGNLFGSSLTAWNFGRNELVTTTVNGFTFTFLKKAADLAIGAPYQSVSGVAGAGAVDVLYGSFTANGLVNSQPNVFDADNTNIGGAQTAAHFGLALY